MSEITGLTCNNTVLLQWLWAGPRNNATTPPAVTSRYNADQMPVLPPEGNADQTLGFSIQPSSVWPHDCPSRGPSKCHFGPEIQHHSAQSLMSKSLPEPLVFSDPTATRQSFKAIEVTQSIKTVYLCLGKENCGHYLKGPSLLLFSKQLRCYPWEPEATLWMIHI